MWQAILKNKTVVSIVVLAFIVAIVYAVYSTGDRMQKRRFYEDNKSDENPFDDLTLSDDKAREYITRLIYDAGNWPWQEDSEVYGELVLLSNADLKRLNNVFLSDFQDTFETPYVSIRAMVENENAQHFFPIKQFLERTSNLF